MQFIDEAKIFIRSGDGGAGCTSFRREAHTPRGGPDGGNGGRGGSIVIEGVAGLNTLIDFRFKQHFKARKGQHGMGRNRDGHAAEDVVIKVPVGTQIFLEDNETLMVDIMQVGQRVVAAKGGDGGFGNAHFKSSTNRAPRRSTDGWDGQEMWLWLKLKLLSDVGLVGLPNAGKSTFLGHVTRAKPKIADYPFTTLKPQLGVTYIDEKEFIIADIPGLFKGAHEGHGLGDRFLKHIERCGVILHLVDGTADNVTENYHTIRQELENYSNKLLEKQEVIALNKCDALTDEGIEVCKQELTKVSGKEVIAISAVTGENIPELLRILLSHVETFGISELPISA